MGLIKRERSNNWYVQFRMDGKTYIRSTKTTDKRLAALIELKTKNQAVETNGLGIKPRLALADALSHFADTKKHQASHAWLANYAKHIRASITGNPYIDQIQSKDLERLHENLFAQGLKSNTVKHIFQLLKGALKYTKRMGYMIPDVEFPSIKVTRGRLRYLTIEEEQRLLDSLDPYRPIPKYPSYEQRKETIKRNMHNQYDFIVTLLDTGARFSEIATLEWDAIDLNNRTIRLWRSKVSNQSILYMTERLYQVFQRRFEVRDPKIKYIFHSRDGRPKPHCSTIAKRIFDRAGLSDCSYHTLRHTHASRLIQHGLSVYEVKEILGHTDIKTTMRYAHLERTDISKRAVEVLNRLNCRN